MWKNFNPTKWWKLWKIVNLLEKDIQGKNHFSEACASVKALAMNHQMKGFQCDVVRWICWIHALCVNDSEMQRSLHTVIYMQKSRDNQSLEQIKGLKFDKVIYICQLRQLFRGDSRRQRWRQWKKCIQESFFKRWHHSMNEFQPDEVGRIRENHSLQGFVSYRKDNFFHCRESSKIIAIITLEGVWDFKPFA
jgi:hypothetical protein